MGRRNQILTNYRFLSHSFFRKTFRNSDKNSRIEQVNHRENGSCYELVSIAIRGLAGLSRRIAYMGLYHCRVSHRLFFFKHISRKLLDIMMGFAAGVMIAASFWSLLQPSIEYVENSPMGAWLGCQRLSVFSWRFFLRLIDAIVPLLHMTKEIDEAESIHTPREKKLSKTILLFLAITIHNFPEGLAVGVAFGALASNPSPEAFIGRLTWPLGLACKISQKGLLFQSQSGRMENPVSMPLLGIYVSHRRAHRSPPRSCGSPIHDSHLALCPFFLRQGR